MAVRPGNYVCAGIPEFAAVARPQRGFLVRAVRFMARAAGIRHAHADALLSSTPQGKCAYPTPVCAIRGRSSPGRPGRWTSAGPSEGFLTGRVAGARCRAPA
ncbi:hypothetical protein ACWDAO_33125, partial [Streptomyces sp. NPDC001212]